jgi:nucleoside-triphosphatase
MRKEGKFIIIGRPGSGKSTCIMLLLEKLRASGTKVGGIRTPELRERGIRKGFAVEDILTGQSDIFASTDFREGPSVSKYRVSVERFESIAMPALRRALEECEVVVIDEIGKMELLSRNFLEVVRDIWESEIISVGTAPLVRIEEIEKLKSSSEVIIIERGDSERISNYLFNRISDLLHVSRSSHRPSPRGTLSFL